MVTVPRSMACPETQVCTRMSWLISHTENKSCLDFLRGIMAVHRRGECRRNKVWYSLFVDHWPQHRDREMREVCCTFIQLQPAHSTMFIHEPGYARFSNAKVLSHPRLQQG